MKKYLKEVSQSTWGGILLAPVPTEHLRRYPAVCSSNDCSRYHITCTDSMRFRKDCRLLVPVLVLASMWTISHSTAFKEQKALRGVKLCALSLGRDSSSRNLSIYGYESDVFNFMSTNCSPWLSNPRLVPTSFCRIILFL